jgi:hypothetical protein
MRLRSILLAVLMVCAAAAAHGQAVLQSGPWQPGHVPVYVGQGSSQAILQDSGPASGGSVGVGLSELGLTVRGTGSPPFANRGTGPLFSNLCDYDAPTNSAGFHYLCFSPNAQGGGLIAYGAAGNAPQLPLNLVLNGTTYPFPFTGQTGVTGGWLNTRLAKTGAYLVSNADKGSTIALSGAGPYTLTFGPASGYDANFLALALNESGAPKTVTLSGGATFTLIAGQSAMVFAQNNVWQYQPPGRLSLTNNIIFYLDSGLAGSDSNDGLTPSTPWKTLQFGWNNVADNYDTRGFVVQFQLADGIYSSLAANHGFVGQAATGSAIIAGHSGNPQAVVIKATAASTAALDFGSGSDSNSPQVVVQDVYLQSTTGNGINAWGAGTSVAMSNVYIFAPLQTLCSSAHGAELSLRSSTTLTAVSGGIDAFSLINTQQNGRWISDSPNITFLGSPNYTGAVFFSANAGNQFLAGGTFTGTVTGSRYSVQALGLIITGTGGNETYLPGSAPGTKLFGGVYD